MTIAAINSVSLEDEVELALVDEVDDAEVSDCEEPVVCCDEVTPPPVLVLVEPTVVVVEVLAPTGWRSANDNGFMISPT